MGHVYLAPNSKNHLCYFYLVFLAHFSIILWIAFIYSSDVSTKLQHRLNMEKDEMDKTVIVSKLLRHGDERQDETSTGVPVLI